MENLTTIKFSDKDLLSLWYDVRKLKKWIYKIKNKEVTKGYQLPAEFIERSGEGKLPNRTRRGAAYSPLTEEEIKEAQSKTVTAVAAAKLIRVNYFTYRKYAKMYGLWKTQVNYTKEKAPKDKDRGKDSLNRILAGECPNCNPFRIKKKLLECGVKANECEMCGYKEQRIADGLVPLILNFNDGDPKNHKLENLKLLCPNCTFCYGRGYLKRGQKYFNYE